MALKDIRPKSLLWLSIQARARVKPSASIGLMARALGSGWRVAYIQFIKHWNVGEHDFIKQIQPIL